MNRLNQMLKLTIVYLFLLVPITQTAAGDSVTADSVQSSIELKTLIEQDEVPLNKQVIYHVELSWLGPLSRLQINTVNAPVTTNLKLISSGSSNRFFHDKDNKPHSIRRITYYFSPLEMGMAYIDGVTVDYEDKALGLTSSLMAQRLGVKIVHPVDEGRNGPRPGTVFLWVLTVLFLVVVAWFVYKYVRRKNLTQQEEQAVPHTLEEKYIALLNDTIHPAGETPSENLDDLLRLLNSYISEKYGLSGMVNFKELQSKLAGSDLPQDLSDKLKSLYERGELTRFAGESLTQNEFHLFYDSVELFLKKMLEYSQKEDKNT